MAAMMLPHPKGFPYQGAAATRRIEGRSISFLIMQLMSAITQTLSPFFVQLPGDLSCRLRVLIGFDRVEVNLGGPNLCSVSFSASTQRSVSSVLDIRRASTLRVRPMTATR